MKEFFHGCLPGSKRRTGTRFATVITIALSVFCHLEAQAQASVHTYSYGYDMKHYSIEKVVGTSPTTNNDEYMMLGTIYNNPDYSGIHPHVLHVDGEGNLLDPPRFFMSTGNYDEYGVDIIDDGSDYFEICLQDRTSAGDRIKIMKTDVTGALLSFGTFSSGGDSWTLESTVTNYDNIVPMHAIWYADHIFICGYLADAYSTYPTYMTPKMSFVVEVDPGALDASIPAGIVQARAYNTTSAGTEDYDIGMRMRVLNNRLFLIGSRNEYFSGAGVNKSATMLLELNLSTLIPTDWSFINRATSPSDHKNEYGVDITETSQGFYVVLGNYFSTNGGTSTFDTQPEALWLTYFSATAGPTYSGSIVGRIEVDATTLHGGAAWGLQFTESLNDITIAGMQSGYVSPCSYYIKPSIDDVHPFLADITLNYPPATGLTFGSLLFWQTHTSQFGTGATGTFSNSYPLLGGSFANIYWNPTFASVHVGQKAVMSAPVWNPPLVGGSDWLNLKFINTNSSGAATDCPDSHNACAPSFSQNYIQAVGSITSTPISSGIIPHEESNNAVDESPYEEPLCDYVTGGGGYQFRTGNGGITEDIPFQVNVFPNPANSHIQIDIQGNTADINLQVELMNIYGQRVAELYNGMAATVPGTQMQLPDVAAGMYLVKVYTNGQLQSQHKLTIE